MPIASLANLQWNGSASMAFVDQVDVEEVVSLKKWASLASQTTIVVTDQYSLTRLRGQPFSTQIVVEGSVGPVKKWTQIKWTTDIAAVPTAYDVAQAVWAQQLSGFGETGSAGKALQDAGAAGNPWSAELASNNTDGTFGWFIQKLLTVAKFLGLK